MTPGAVAVVIPARDEEDLLPANSASYEGNVPSYQDFRAATLVDTDSQYVVNGDEVHTIPAVPGIKVVDTTGAGDAFVGGFAAGLLHFKGNPLSAARFANAVAALQDKIADAENHRRIQQLQEENRLKDADIRNRELKQLALALVALLIQLRAAWATVPFHFIWVSLTIVYGLRVVPWSSALTAAVWRQADAGPPIQTKALGVYTPMFCFLLLGFLFYSRHGLARVMFSGRGAEPGAPGGVHASRRRPPRGPDCADLRLARGQPVSRHRHRYGVQPLSDHLPQRRRGASGRRCNQDPPARFRQGHRSGFRKSGSQQSQEREIESTGAVER